MCCLVKVDLIPLFDLTKLNGINGFVIYGILAGQQLGYSLSTGDINGDGISDLVTSAQVLGGEDVFGGDVYVVYGQSRFDSPFNLSNLNGINGFVVNGRPEDGLGPICTGDINGDGKADLVLGSLKFSSSVYILFGQRSIPSPFNLSTLNGTNGFKIDSIRNIEYFSVSTADINGDGKDDLLLGVNSTYERVFVIFGRNSTFDNSFDLLTLNGTNGFVVYGIPSGDTVQTCVSTAGDINGDGKHDIVLGVWRWSQSDGNVYVIYGQSDFGSGFFLTNLNGINGFSIPAISSDGTFGSSVSTAGDINADGKSDLVLGDTGASFSGMAFVVFGQDSFPMNFNLGSLDGTNGFAVNGILDGDCLGSSVGTAGDINGDNIDDVVIGAFDAPGYAGNGAAYIIFGKNTRAYQPEQIPFYYYLIGCLIAAGLLVILVGCSYIFKKTSQHNSITAQQPVSVKEYDQLIVGKVSEYGSPTLTITESIQEHDSEKYWQIDNQITKKGISEDKIYELVEAGDSDKRKVIEFYEHCPVSGYEIASVRVIHNPDMNKAFTLHMKKLQHRDNNPAFTAKWINGREYQDESLESEEITKWRHVVNERLKAIAKPYQDSNYPAVSLMPMWHGTKKEIIDSIFKTGYANLATTDTGFFGKGIYSAYEAEYSYRVYAKEGGALIFNWVACFSAYPVTDCDMKKLEGKGNYSNYDAHFIPVVPRNPDNPDEEVYFPCSPNRKHQYTELVVFASEACLPRYLVELRCTLEKPLPLNRNEDRSIYEKPLDPKRKKIILIRKY